MTEQELAEKIRRAFTDCPRPAEHDITEADCCSECDALAAWLRNHTWESLLDQLSAGEGELEPSFLLKPQAFRYFTPAYLIAALRSEASTEERLFAPSYALAPGETSFESFRSKYLDGFSPEERESIVAYLAFLHERDTEAASYSRQRIEQALAELWRLG